MAKSKTAYQCRECGGTSSKWQMEPSEDSVELISNGMFGGGNPVHYEDDSYHGTHTCTASTWTKNKKCGEMEIKTHVEGSAGCDKTDKSSPFYQTKNKDCNFLHIEPADGNRYGEYQINSKPNSIGYAGTFEISLWAKCGNDWDGDHQLLHSRFYDTSGEEIGITTGGWFNSQETTGMGTSAKSVAKCKANVWRKISKTFDSQGKAVGSFSIYVGYPMKATTGFLEVTKISVKPIIWKAQGGSLQIMSSAGGRVNDELTTGFHKASASNSYTKMITKWLVLGEQGEGRSTGKGPFEQGNHCGIHPDSVNDIHAQTLPSMDGIKKGDKYGTRTWVEYRRNGYDSSDCNSHNSKYLIDLMCHFNGADARWRSKVEHSNAFALSYIYSAMEREIDMYLSSDDGQYVWLNGILVRENPNLCQTVSNKGNGKFAITLKQGINKLMVRIGNWYGRWGFVPQLVCKSGDRSCFDTMSAGINPPNGASDNPSSIS